MATQVPETDVAAYLAANPPGGLASGSIFQGQVQPESDTVPGPAVFVRDSRSPPPGYHHGAGTTSRRQAFIQVRVRSATDDYSGGLALAKAVWEALDRAAITGYDSLEALQDHFVWIEQDQPGHHEWSANFVLFYDA